MAKELPYFRFTAQEWQNGNISLEDYALKGLFIDVCAYYWVKNCELKQAMLKKRFRDANDMIDELISLGVIKHNKKTDFINIEYLDEQLEMLQKKREVRQRAGSKGGKQRSRNAKAMLKQSSSYKDKDKDKSKNIPSLDEFMKYAIEDKPKVKKDEVRRKYKAWKENNWKDGNDKKIKNWKSKLLNTLRYIDEEKQQKQHKFL